MLYDPSVTDATFAHGPPPENIHQILASARRRLSLNGDPTWRLISARRRFGKALFEIEERSGSETRRLIGKVCKSERADTLYQALNRLREGGFQPPSKLTVPEAVACVPDTGFILVEKVRGVTAADLMAGSQQQMSAAAAGAGRWLAALHRSNVPAPMSPPPNPLSTWATELANVATDWSAYMTGLVESIERELSRNSTPLVPCHGDFHPANIFIAESGQVTAIDIDKFGLRERESDIGSFLMQSAAFDFLKNGSFKHTIEGRRAFLDSYESKAEYTVDRHRVGAYIAAAFLKNLHFELVLLHTEQLDHVGPWLTGAASAIQDGNIFLAS